MVLTGSPWLRIAATIGLGVVYALLAWMGFRWLATPAGPPAILAAAGVGVAGLVRLGPWAWPAVFLGMGAAYAAVDGSFSGLAAAGLAATAATIGALLGRALALRLIDPALPLSNGRELAGFMLVTAPLASVPGAIAAGLGVAIVSGVAEPAVVGALLTWWLAEALGIAVVGAPLLVLLAPAERWLPPRRIVVCITLCLCLLGTWMVGLVTNRYEAAQNRDEFRDWARPVSRHIEYALHTNAHLLVNAGHWLGDLDDETRDERFFSVAQHTYEQGEAIDAIGWVAWIRDEERDTFEQQMQAFLDGFAITEAEGNRLRPADRRAVYAPLQHIANPHDDRTGALGFDLLSETVRREAVEATIRRGTITATSRPVRIHSPQRILSTLLFVPLYEDDVPGHDGPLENAPLRGILNAALDLHGLIGPALDVAEARSAVLTIVDVTDPAEPVALLSIRNGTDPTSLSDVGPDPAAAESAPPDLEREVAFASRTWAVRLHQPPQNAAPLGWQSSIALWASLLFSSVLLALVLVLSGRTLTYQRLAQQRYLELQSASTTVDEQVRDRMYAEAMLDDSERKFATLAMASPVMIYHADAYGRIDFVNRKAEQIVGCPSAALFGDGWLRFVHDHDRPPVSTQWEQAVTSGRPLHAAYRMTRPDGETIEVLEQGVPVRDAAGTLTGFVGTITDVTALKETERALVEAEQRYRMATEAGGTAVWTADLKRGRYIIDGGLAAKLGVPSKQHTCDTWQSLIYADDRDWVAVQWNDCRNGRRYRLDLECRAHDSDGSLRWLDVHGTVIRDGEGSAVMITGIVRDVTERKQQEEALRSSELRYRTLLDNLPDYIGRFDHDMRHIYLNCGPLETLPEAGAAGPGSTLAEIGFERQEAERLEHAIAAVFESGEPASLDHDLTLNGGVRHFEFRMLPEFSTPQQIASVLTIGRDVTERRRAEHALENARSELERRVAERTDELEQANRKLIEANRDLVQEIIHRGEIEQELRHSQRFIENILNADPSHIYIADLNSRCAAFVNRRLADFLGIDPGDPGAITADGISDRLHPEDHAALMRHLDALWQLPDGEAAECELRLRSPRDDYRWMHLYDTVFARDREGRPTQVLGTAVDVTDRKMAEIGVRRAERLAAIGTLAAGIAHEINNPLGTILISAHEVRSSIDEGSSGERDHARDMLEQIIASTNRCGDIVKRVLRFTRQIHAERGQHDLAEVARNAIEITHRYIEHQGATVNLDAEPGLPPASIFATEIEQVFINMIQNAVHAGADHVHIRIRSEDTRDDGPRPQEGDDDYPLADGGCNHGRITVEIRDNGHGISDADAGRIFDPFFTTRLHEGGTGLGLSICHGIVSDHGGEIRIVHTGPDGTTFRFDLPVAGSDGNTET